MKTDLFRIFKKREAERIPTIHNYFQIREIKDDLAIMNNGSLHSILDIGQIPRTSSIKRLAKLVNLYHDILLDLDFDIKICIRHVNNNLAEKFSILSERSIFNLKKSGKFSHIREFREFMDWLDESKIPTTDTTKKIYLLVSSYSQSNDISYEQLKVRLSNKLSNIVKEIKKLGISQIVRLDSANLENLFKSYLVDSIYLDNDYALPEHLIHLFKIHKMKSTTQKQKISNSSQRKLEEIKKHIKMNSPVHEDDLAEFYKNLSEKEMLSIQSLLSIDENILIADQIYKYVDANEITQSSDSLLVSVHQSQGVEHFPDHMRIGNAYMRAYTVTAYPEEAPKGKFLQNIFLDKNSIDVTLDINVESKHNVISYYRRKIKEIELEMHDLNEKGYVNETLESKKRNIQKKIGYLEKGKIFRLSIYFLIKGTNLDQLNAIDQKLHTLTRANRLFIKPVVNFQQQTLKTICPLDANFLLHAQREVVTTSELLAQALPFV